MICQDFVIAYISLFRLGLEHWILQIDHQTRAYISHTSNETVGCIHPAAYKVYKRSCLLFAFAFFSRNGRKVVWIPQCVLRLFRGRNEKRNLTSVFVLHLKGPPFFFSLTRESLFLPPSFIYLPICLPFCRSFSISLASLDRNNVHPRMYGMCGPDN